MKSFRIGTFSILAISPESKSLGVAVASGSAPAGYRVPHAKPGIGVVATQAFTNVVYGLKGLQLLARGLSPIEALDRLLQEDPDREWRQVAIMDFKGKKAVYTGSMAPGWCGEIVGDDYAVIGNMLAGKEVLSSMAKEFEFSSGDLAWRMAKALKAGSNSGGDRRGEISAALIVVGAEKVEVKLRVFAYGDPVGELCRRLKSQ
jgi:uncharacterized Ntn-hydrolase superfamily protein